MPRGKRRHEDDLPRTQTSKRGRLPVNTRRPSRQEPPPPPTFSQRVCIKWFQHYALNDDTEVLGPEGMERFCVDIGVDPADVAMLVLAWKMSAKQMGYFTLQEWIRGLTDLQCDSKEKLRDKLDFLRSLLKDPALFKSIFRYAFDFARDKDQRSMDIETSKAMLKLLLADHWRLFLHFIAFLDDSKYRVINKDQWANILEFARTIHDDLSNYDVDGAWPVMLDEFVEWLKKLRESGNRFDSKTGGSSSSIKHYSS